MIDPQSPVHFTSVTALHRVQCGSFNHNPLEEVAQSMEQLIYYFCKRYCYHYDSKNLYYYLDITLIN